MNKFRVTFVLRGKYDTDKEIVEETKKEFGKMFLKELIERMEEFEGYIESISEIELRKIPFVPQIKEKEGK